MVFKKSTGGQHDSEILVTGDETLPWRQNRNIPWNEQSVNLKKTQRQFKQIEKEKLEAVELKPSKIQKTAVDKAELEKVDLRRHMRQIEDTTSETEEITETAEERRKRIYREKYQTEEDSNLLDVQRREETQEAIKPEEPVYWRRGKKEQPQVEEEPKLPEEPKQVEQSQEPVYWKRGQKKPKEEVQPESLEEPAPVAETLEETQKAPWQRGKKEKAKVEEPEKSKTEEVPWNQKVGQLKKTPRESKPVEKEKVEAVALKPSKIQKSDIQKEELETVDLKRQMKKIEDHTSEVNEEDLSILKIKKAVKEKVSEEAEYKDKYSTEEDTNLLDVQCREETEEAAKPEEPVYWRRGKKEQPQVEEEPKLSEEPKQVEQSQEPVYWKRGQKKPKEEVQPESFEEPAPVAETLEETQKAPWQRGKKEMAKVEEEPEESKTEEVPWNQKVGQLKKTPRESRPVEKEKVEAVALKPSKIQKSDIQKEELETVDLKRQMKKIEDHTNEVDGEDLSILKIKKAVKEEVSEEAEYRDKYSTEEDTNLLDVQRLEETGEAPKPEEPVYWRRGMKEQPKVEEELKVFEEPKQVEQPQEPIYWKRGQKKPKEEVQPESLEEPAPVAETLEETQKAPWQRGKKEKAKVEGEPEESKTEEVPWNQKVGQLKKTQKSSKPIEKEKVENVELKPSKVQKSDIEKPELEEVGLKHIKKPIRDMTSEIVDEFMDETLYRKPTQNEEDTSVLEVAKVKEVLIEEMAPESVEEQQKAPWRRGKKAIPEEEVPEEKSWPTGKRHPVEPEPVDDLKLKPIPQKAPQKEIKPEEVDLKLIPKKPTTHVPSVPDEIKFEPEPLPETIQSPEEPQKAPWQRGKKQKPQEEVPEEKSWPTGKRRPVEPEPVDDFKLKPIPKKAPQEEIKPEEVDLKLIPQKPTTHAPSVPDEIKFKPESVPETIQSPEEPQKAPWQRGKKQKPQEEVPEEKSWPTGKRHPVEPEPVDDLKLKPIPKKAPQEEIKPEEEDLKLIPQKPTTQAPSVPEEIEFKPEPVPETIQSPEEPQKAPWQRGKKQKPQEEVPEEKSWPTGKRSPFEPEPIDDLKLIPIPEKAPQEEIKLEEVALKPVLKKLLIEINEPDTFEKLIISQQSAVLTEPEVKKEPEQPQATSWRRGKKEKPKEEISEEKTLPSGKRRPAKPEEPAEEVQLKPIPQNVPELEEQYEVEFQPEEPEQELLEETVEEEHTKEKKKRKKKHKSKHGENPHEEIVEEPLEEEPEPEEPPKPKKEKHVAFREELSTIEILSDSNDELLDQYEENLSREQIALKPTLKKPHRREQQKVEEEMEVEEFKKETQVVTSSQAVRRVRKQLLFDESQPIPDLEIISQKRLIEGINKIAEESIIEDKQLKESKTQISSKSLLEKTQVKTTMANIRPPKFVQKLQPVVSEPQKPVVLKGEVDGNPFPDIKWFFNESELSNSELYEMTSEKSNVTLKIKAVKETDVGIYTCQAINPGGVATSRTNVIVQEPEQVGEAPSFITPLKITVPEDKDKAVVTCQVYGIPKPIVKWYKEEVEIVPNADVQTIYEEESGYVTLEVYNPETNVPVNYTIKAENEFGKAIGKANVFIQSIIIEKKAEVRAPKILTPLQAQVVKTQSTLKFECKYDGLPVPKIKWIKNGKEIIIDETTTIETHEYVSRLEIRNITKKHGGKYEIIVTNKAGEAKSSGSVVVSDSKETAEVRAPRFIEPITPKTVAEAEVVILEATVDSFPTASFQWFYNNNPITSSQDTRIATTDNKSILIIETFVRTHVGSYTCRAENVAGSVTSTATINMLEPSDTEEITELISPRFVEKAESAQVMDGEKLILTARVQGAPIPKVEWQHNGDTVEESKDIFTQQDNSGLCTLTIKEIFPEDAGEYVCIAKNKIGEAVSRCIVTVDGKTEL